MKVVVNLYASLTRYRQDGSTSGPIEFDAPEGTTVRELMEALHIPLDEIKLIFRNGRRAGQDDILCSGDRLGVFPPIGGG